ncbi:MAG: PEP-CTERM sorting domain-containing protein, partial [Pirellulaceae bacterium]
NSSNRHIRHTDRTIRSVFFCAAKATASYALDTPAHPFPLVSPSDLMTMPSKSRPPETNSHKKLTATQKVAATAGALACMAPATTESDVVYVNDRPVTATVFDGQGSTANWDVDGANGADFQLWVRSFMITSSSYISSNNFFRSSFTSGAVNFASQSYGSVQLNGRGLVGNGANGVNALNQSFIVGPTLASYAWGSTSVKYRSALQYNRFFTSSPGFTTSTTNATIAGNLSNFSPGTNMLGFRFDINGSTHYGWAEVDITNNNTELTITRWAYESDADTAIHVGAIPEPGSLGLLGLGAAGLLAFRRRRKNGE